MKTLDHKFELFLLVTRSTQNHNSTYKKNDKIRKSLMPKTEVCFQGNSKKMSKQLQTSSSTYLLHKQSYQELLLFSA